ncbi:MAG: hypothetical protein NT121_09770 [Chloroflexi bacterium]|nr:hypothetical protein [Chloroflexota bacterium]
MPAQRASGWLDLPDYTNLSDCENRHTASDYQIAFSGHCLLQGATFYLMEFSGIFLYG